MKLPDPRRTGLAKVYENYITARLARRRGGTLLAFVIGLGEYVASVLVFVPINRPISIAHRV